MIFSENRYPLFGIMLWSLQPAQAIYKRRTGRAFADLLAFGFVRSSDRMACKKIQAICNAKSRPITIQGLACAGEKPPAQ